MPAFSFLSDRGHLTMRAEIEALVEANACFEQLRLARRQKYAIEKKRGDINELGKVYQLTKERFGSEKMAQEAAYLAFGLGGYNGAALPWTDPAFFFVRNAGSGTQQLIARAYGCLATPHVFIFDKARRLRYAGRFDDSRFPQEDTVKSPDARNAIFALLDGKPVPVELTKPHGCSTKWREKKAASMKAEAAWTKIPVTLETIDAAGVAALRANPTAKVRLINVWATWCHPCRTEIPELRAIHAKYQAQGLELVGVSVDTDGTDDAIRSFMREFQMTFPIWRDPDERVSTKFLVVGVPATFLIDREGVLRWRKTGPIAPGDTTLTAAIQRALGS